MPLPHSPQEHGQALETSVFQRRGRYAQITCGGYPDYQLDISFYLLHASCQLC